MKLSRKDWNKYVSMLSAINKTAGRKMQAWIDKHGTGDVEALVEYAYALTTKYGEASSALACQMYDEIAAVQKANVPPAEPKMTQNVKYVDKAIRSTMDRAPSMLAATVSEMVKRTGAETTLKNALRDGAYFAWVPNGDTCAFCMTLASNGWRRASRKTINGDHAEHIHKNCDCEFAISFNGPGQIEGYDPDRYLQMYENAEGEKWKDKVNSMRRAQYAVNKYTINAQKRAAYARRMETKKSLDEGGGSGYNNHPIDDSELQRRYERDVREGWISALSGYDNYKNLYHRIEKEIVGLETKTGLTIKSQSEHFLARVIGSSIDQNRVLKGVYKITGAGPQGHRSVARNGVGISDIEEAILEGRAYPIKAGPDGSRSQRFKGDKCVVTINPDTGNLIQCNPRSR